MTPASLWARLAGEKYKDLSAGRAALTAGICLFAFAVSGAPAFLETTPFGVAMLCAVDTALPALTVALSLGAAARGEVLLIPIYIILLLFRLITSMWLGEESKRVNTALCAVGMTAYGLFELFALPGGAALLKTVVGTAVAVMTALCAREAAESAPGKKAGILAAVYAAGCAVSGFSLYGIGAGNALGFIICMNLARYGGGTFGCTAGALWGLGCAPEYAPAFAVSALIGAKTSSPLLGVGAGAVFCMLFATFVGGYHGIRDFLPDIAIAAAAYAPLSRLGWMKWDALITPPAEEEADSTATEKEKRLSAVAGALGSLSAIFYGMSDRLKDRDGYERTTDMTGAFADDYAAMSELICSALREEDDAPDPLLAGRIYGMLRMSRVRCGRVSVSGERIKRIRISGLGTGVMNDPELFAKRISNLCGVPFKAPSFTVGERSVSASLVSAPVYSVEWSTAARAKPGEQVSGDCTTAFTAEDGRFFCVLCDGMGSGTDAAIAARTCCVFLQKMLEGGAEPALSVRMLNTFLRGKGYECFATVDIFCLDLYTGKAFFIKGGSAPSHLLRAGSEYTMSSATAPVGIIREVYAEKISFDAADGDCILMRSDGAGEDAPREIRHSASADAIARDLLKAALSGGTADDTTVCVMKVKKL